jgi:hypothetical protein
MDPLLQKFDDLQRSMQQWALAIHAKDFGELHQELDRLRQRIRALEIFVSPPPLALAQPKPVDLAPQRRPNPSRTSNY